MCVLDNTAQGRGQGKKQAHLEDSWQGAWRKKRDEMSGIICRKEIFDRKPYIMPNRIVVKCELRDVIHSLLPPLHTAHLTFSRVVRRPGQVSSFHL
jgi:hypothetical protein